MQENILPYEAMTKKLQGNLQHSSILHRKNQSIHGLTMPDVVLLLMHEISKPEIELEAMQFKI